MCHNSILLVDDEKDVLRATTQVLKDDFQVFQASDGKQALELFSEHKIDVVILDVNMPGLTGVEVLAKIKAADPLTEVIMLTAVAAPQTIIQAMQAGAYDYIVKPYDPDELLIKVARVCETINLKKENISLKEQLSLNDFENMIGSSEAMQKVYSLIKKVSATESTVLITGETGTGKELVAKAIHNHSSRKNRPFITVNAGGIPDSLLESELFGYKKGSFTNAVTDKIGKFECANGGTIFLDEIGNMPLVTQAKILRVIQEKELEKLGDTKVIPLDLRIIAATNANLEQAIADGTFRADLFHRLNVIQLVLPPLRERITDIPELIQHFLKKYCQKFGKPLLKIQPDTMSALQKYAWPGNVRELEHVIERITILEDDPEVKPSALPNEFQFFQDKSKPDSHLESVIQTPPLKSPQLVDLKSDPGRSLSNELKDYERALIEKALQANHNNQSQTAKVLGLSRTTLITKMKVLGLGN